MGEETYMDKGYCLECMTKHSRDFEHHAEDLVTASKNNPNLRDVAQDIVDNARDLRKQVDELRVEEYAKKKLKQVS